MSTYPPAPVMYPLSSVIATAPQWVFQSIDLPPNPEVKPWSRYCTVIDITSGRADHKATALGLNTYALGLNNLGDVVGYYADPNYDQHHAFRRSRDGKIDIFDVPVGDKNPKPAAKTRACGINDDGYIVGQYQVVSDGPSRPFLCRFRPNEKPSLKNFATWKVPDQPDASTSFAKINNLGQIAGSYVVDRNMYGFILRGGVPNPNKPEDLTWLNDATSTILDTESSFGFPPFMEPIGINDAGDIVGTANPIHTATRDLDGGRAS